MRTLLRAVRRALNLTEWVDLSGRPGTPVLTPDGEHRIGTLYGPLSDGAPWQAVSVHRPGIVLTRTSRSAAVASLVRIDAGAGGDW